MTSAGPAVSAPASKAERLRAAVAAHAAVVAKQQAASPRKPAPARTSDDLPPLREILRGEWEETQHGPAFVREEWFPLDHRHGSYELGAPLGATAASLEALARCPAPHPSRLGFFDIETTGLGGGTGTYVILAGLGWFADGGFRLRQYFLADVGAERAMLALLEADASRLLGIVTYNGKAFDLPIVAGRYALARTPPPFDGLAHIDLLHAVRRLYKHRMPGCTLAQAERSLLSLHRPDDIPGALIPALYFDYARAGRAAPLRAVFAHNADDVLSMVGILAGIAGLLAAEAELEASDAVAVARWWEREGDESRAAALYRPALEWLQGGDDWAWAAARYARLCRRLGQRDEAAVLWRRLWEAGGHSAGVELAKHLEHHARDFTAAEDVVASMLESATGAELEALAARLARIGRKRAQAEARQLRRTA